jgi:hypothetical protein
MSRCWSMRPPQRFAPPPAPPVISIGGYSSSSAAFPGTSCDHAAQSLSLFAERRLFELRMPSGKPDKGAARLEDLAARPPPDVIYVDRLGQAGQEVRRRQLGARRGKARSLDTGMAGRRGGHARLGCAPGPRRCRWSSNRRRRSSSSSASRAILLAAKQELQKLRLLEPNQPISVDLVLRSVGDSARYDVFQLAQAAAAGDAARALACLSGLKSEGVEPSLILWALVRELRGLWQARERERLRSNARGSGWNLAASPSPQALGQDPQAAAGAADGAGQPHRPGHQGVGGGRCLERHHRLDLRLCRRFASDSRNQAG